MSKTLRNLVKARVRRAHVENVIRSADDKAIPPSLAFTSGYKAPWPAAPDISRRVRRKLERQSLKRMGMAP